ncbi:MAG: molybdopterin converting factor subunit 1 [Spirochaetota bacterium]
MRVKVKLFASFKDICGFAEKELIVSEAIKVSEIVDMLIKSNREFAEKKDTLLVAVNEEYCSLNKILQEGDTIALFPPVSGG